jgi:hypothetical protein
MRLKLLVVGGLALLASAQALAQECSKGPFRGKALELAREAYPQLVAMNADWTFTRDQLAEFRSRERSCAGQSSLDYLLVLADVQQGDLQSSIEAMGALLKADVDALEKNRMMARLISRFVAANEIPTAISLTRLAIHRFPDQAPEYTEGLILLLAGTGQFEEARTLADAKLEAALAEARPDCFPYAAWVRLAVSEVSGDASDEAAVVSRLTGRYGQATAALLERDQTYYDYATLLHLAYNPKAYPQPVVPIKVQYPDVMLWSGAEALCEVRFDIGLDGMPEGIQAACTSEGFVHEAKRAVSEVRFEPPIVNGTPRRFYNVVYPLQFSILR